MTSPDFAALHLQLGQLSQAATLPHNERASADRAAVEVGKALAALAGWHAMSRAFDYVEMNVGEREAVWLSRRWSGITDPTGATWS